jgi:hypothetical protein
MRPWRGVMPAEPARLQVFISYATEDENLARSIGDELRKAFGPTILKVSIAAEYKLGASWRQGLEDDLNTTDILLIVATGLQKLSHSFTGFEVGYFKGSRKYQPRMMHFESERLIIPIAIATNIPDPVVDVQSLQLDTPLDALNVQQGNLRDQNTFLESVGYASRKNPLLKLFTRIQSVIKTAIELSDEELEAFDEAIRNSSKRLHETIFAELRRRVSTESFPERKIIIRMEARTKETKSKDPLAGATIEFLGRSFELFGFDPPGAGERTCEGFLATIPAEQIAASWADIIRSLVVAARQGDFRENRRLLASADQTRFFRIFVARSVLFYSGVTELHIYVVEVKSRDYGDPGTTMLLKAISVGLQYRFMFLERNSEFSPASFALTLLDGLHEKISHLIQELDFLLWMSKDAGLREPENLLRIYGQSLGSDELDERAALWEQHKDELYLAAYAVLGVLNPQDLSTKKREFIKVLKLFCNSTQEMNRDFTARTLRALEDVVSKSDDEPVMTRAAE